MNQKKSVKPTAEDKALDLFAEMMIKKIETMQADWKKPWFTEGVLNWPENLSGRQYNGMNALMLTLLCENEGYKIPVFCTFDRVQALNAVKDKQGKLQQATDGEGNPLPRIAVKKGEHSFPVFITVFRVVHKETGERITYDEYKNLSQEDANQYNCYPRMQVYHVFNIDQTNMKDARPDMYRKYQEKLAPAKPEERKEKMFDFPAVDAMIDADKWICKITPKYGDDAYYSISKNEIVIPEKKQFRDGESFYSNLFHEMAHSTGAEAHLNRLKPSSFGSKDYAREELVAELSAALASQQYGMIKHLKDDSAAYLKIWLGSLHEEPSFIKQVLQDVKKASGMIVQCVNKVQVELENQRMAS